MTMISIRVTIPERLLRKIEDSKLDESEVIIEALNSYFDRSKGSSIDIHWRKFIEAKLEDLQNQIDQHRMQSSDDNMVELDSDLRKRHLGERAALDVASADTIRVSNPPPVNHPKPPNRKCTIQEITMDDDFDLKL